MPDDISARTGATDPTSDQTASDHTEYQALAQERLEELSYLNHRTPRSYSQEQPSTIDTIVYPGTHQASIELLMSLLIEAFKLPKEETLIDHYPAWLLKSVMLQGRLYLTSGHVCFYSYIPRGDDITIKSGYLTKKSRTTSRQHRHWFVLKNNILSYYSHASDLYYPNGNIDLKRAKAAVFDLKSSGEEGIAFKLITTEREYVFRADTASAANEWIKVLQKMIFRLNNDGDCVKIAIPIASVLDIEESDVLPFATTMKIKIADDIDTFAINEYYFSFFSGADAAFEAIKFQLNTSQNKSYNSASVEASFPRGEQVSDTSKAAPSYSPGEVLSPAVGEEESGGETLLSVEEFAREMRSEDETHLPLSASRILRLRKSIVESSPDEQLQHTSLENLQEQAAERQEQQHPKRTTSLTRTLGSHIKSVGQAATSAIQAPLNIFTKSANQDDPGAESLAAAEVFRREFGLPDNERLLKTCQPFYRHGVPVTGDFYISDSHICYKSSTPGSKIRIMLPLEAVETAKQATGFHFGLSALVLAIRAHEDIFFGFSHASERDQCIHFIEGALENLKALKERNLPRPTSQDSEKAREEHHALEQARKNAGGLNETYRPPLEDLVGVPALIFDSPNASMVAFKPAHQLHITCLTIGSRGDVQPYVALCKGLIADGQKARIVTHEEFRDFVESHGIEFAPVDGNPAELMSICVEHGMFTYSFLREASRKFRGWLDSLLSSSWLACQNTDVLIESPSAMGGIHIAEALGIPYFRAFTMPWTKTRVYPHAFAVPEHNSGGNWNSLTYSAFDTLFWKAISGQVNRWRKSALKLPSTSFGQLAQHKIPFLYNFSPSVVPPAIDWHDWIKVTGYWFLDGADDRHGEKWTAPDEVTKFISKARNDDKKLVYIGFGSIVVSDPKALTKAVIEAVKQSGVRCILVKGWSARSSKSADYSDDEGDVKQESAGAGGDGKVDEASSPADQEEAFGSEILSLDSIPHDWLFPQIDAACHHGGAGSLGASLRAGVPTIVKPFFGDQYFFGDRVQNLGVGVCLRKLTVSHLRDAIQLCTTDRLTIQKARVIGEQIRSENGVDFAIQCIYRDLDYARSLVKRPRRLTGTSEKSEESWQVIDYRDEDASDIDDSDLYDNRRDAEGNKYSILKSLKNLKLPNPLGEKSGSYGLSGIKVFKQSAKLHKQHLGD